MQPGLTNITHGLYAFGHTMFLYFYRLAVCSEEAEVKTLLNEVVSQLIHMSSFA